MLTVVLVGKTIRKTRVWRLGSEATFLLVELARYFVGLAAAVALRATRRLHVVKERLLPQRLRPVLLAGGPWAGSGSRHAGAVLMGGLLVDEQSVIGGDLCVNVDLTKNRDGVFKHAVHLLDLLRVDVVL